MARVHLEYLPLNINRVEHSLGALYVRSVLRGDNPATELHSTIQEGLWGIQAEYRDGIYDVVNTHGLLMQRFVRLVCLMWLLSQVCGVAVRTENFCSEDIPQQWDGVTLTLQGERWYEKPRTVASQYLV